MSLGKGFLNTPGTQHVGPSRMPRTIMPSGLKGMCSLAGGFALMTALLADAPAEDATWRATLERRAAWWSFQPLVPGGTEDLSLYRILRCAGRAVECVVRVLENVTTASN